MKIFKKSREKSPRTLYRDIPPEFMERCFKHIGKILEESEDHLNDIMEIEEDIKIYGHRDDLEEYLTKFTYLYHYKVYYAFGFINQLNNHIEEYLN